MNVHISGWNVFRQAGRGSGASETWISKEEAEDIFEKSAPLMPVGVLSLSIIVPKPRIVERIQT